jgi:ribosomal protein S18 acetylase RimI-like enzyme
MICGGAAATPAFSPPHADPATATALSTSKKAASDERLRNADQLTSDVQNVRGRSRTPAHAILPSFVLLASAEAASGNVGDDALQIREFREDDLDTVVAFSLRAWAPVFESVREVLGEDLFRRLHPDWQVDQAQAVRSSCLNEERDVFVAIADSRPVGFVAIALNAFHERMGVIEIIGVDPDYQRRGISSRLTEYATEHMQRRGMDISVVETGGDPGHAPARAVYEAAGFTLLPIARYFRLLG